MTTRAQYFMTMRCLVCGGASFQTLIMVNSYEIIDCTTCGFRCVSPRPTAEQLKAIYSNVSQNPYLKEHFEATADERPTLRQVVDVLRSKTSGRRLFEVGCGRGDLLIEAKGKGYDVDGCDFGTTPDNGVIRVRRGALPELTLEKSGYDVFVARNILEHALDPNTELQAMSRYLKLGGFVYIKVPCTTFEYGWLSKIAFKRPHVFEPPYHLNHFTKRTLRTILENNGFRVIAWLMERPTRHPDRLTNFIQLSAYVFIRTCSLLTFGLAFPKPILVCIAVKKASASEPER